MKRLFFIALTLLFLGLNVLPASAVKFIQVTDTNFSKANPEGLEDFVEEINSDFRDIDFVVFTGDNLKNADSRELYAFLKTVKKLNPRVYVLMGDRDLSESKQVTSENYMYTAKRVLGFYHSSKPNYVFKKGKIVFLTMNGVKEYFPGVNGCYTKAELDWLDKMLTKYSKRKVVILQHFPLVDSASKTQNLYKKDNYLNVLNSHNNVIAIVSGHYHKNMEVKENNIFHIVTRNFSNNTFYKIIEIDESDNFIYTSLIDNSAKE